MTTSQRPESITMYPGEEDRYEPDLNFGYIDQTAHDVALVLDRTVLSAEVDYQPGDGTRYPLVFVPLAAMTPANDDHGGRAIKGVKYDRGMFLVCWVEHPCYPLRLAGRGGSDIAADYVSEKWKTSSGSAVSLALLFRGVAYYLDRFDRSREEARKGSAAR